MIIAHDPGPGPEELPRERWEAAVTGLVSMLTAGGRSDPTADDDDLAVAAELHGVEGRIRALVGPGNRRLDLAVHAALGRHQRALSDLEVVADALDAAGVPFLVVKGPALVATLYAEPSLRSYVDLDVCVRPIDLGRAVHALEAAGCPLVDANWPLLSRVRVHELRVGGPSGGGIDLHWALGYGPTDQDTSPPMQTLLDRSTVIEIGGREVRTLGPADTVAHLIVHAATSGGHRLIWVGDIAAALDRLTEPGGAGSLLDVVDEWQARPAAAVMLARVRRTTGRPLAPDVARLLRPGVWTGLVAVVDRWSPPELAGTGGSSSRLLARSARPTTGRSLAAAAAKTWAWWRGRGQEPLTRAELLDPTSPESALHPVGGAAAAEAFFAEVAAGQGRPAGSF